MATIDINSPEWIEYEALVDVVYENFLINSVEEMERLPDNPLLVAFQEKQGWSQEDLDLARDLSIQVYIDYVKGLPEPSYVGEMVVIHMDDDSEPF